MYPIRGAYPEYIKNFYIQQQKINNLIKKWVECLNRQFSRGIRMARKLMKRC